MSAGEPSATDCADYLEQIVYFIDNELAEADCDAVRVHLDTCNPCLEKYDLQRTVKSMVALVLRGGPAGAARPGRSSAARVQVRISEGSAPSAPQQ